MLKDKYNCKHTKLTSFRFQKDLGSLGLYVLRKTLSLIFYNDILLGCEKFF